MAIVDTVTVSLLQSVLASADIRRLFTSIASRRIAESGPIKAGVPEAEQKLAALEDAHLISASTSGASYFVTAKGLKVARDLGKLIAS